MSSILDREPGKRWPRSQRFKLSVKGAEVEVTYRQMVTDAKTGDGRAAFDAARATWATQATVEPGDGLFLAELQSKPLSVEELVHALEPCGTTKKEIKAALDRLTDKGMVDAV